MNEEEIMKGAVDMTNSPWGGNTLEDAAKFLSGAKELELNIFIKFHGKNLYSMLDDIDSCYKKVTGYTYKEYKEAEKEEERKYIQKKLDALDKIPERIEKGKNYIYPQREMDWTRIVIKSSESLYLGYDIDATVEIMEILANNNNANKFEMAIEKLANQGHSGPSYWLVLKNVLDFSKEGVNFYKYAMEKKNEALSEDDINYIYNIESQNEEFEAELNALENE